MRFDDVHVGSEGLLGEPGRGFPILGAALDTGRFSVAARCVGQAQRAIDLTLPYARDRRAFGQPIGERLDHDAGVVVVGIVGENQINPHARGYRECAQVVGCAGWRDVVCQAQICLPFRF